MGTAPALVGQPSPESLTARLVVAALIVHMGQGVHRVPGGWFGGQGLLGQGSGLVVTPLLLAHEGEQGRVEPALPVRRGGPLDHAQRGGAVEVAQTGERDGGHRDGEPQRIARVLLQVAQEGGVAVRGRMQDTAGDDVHEGALVVVGPLAHRAPGIGQGPGDVHVGPALMADERERGMAEGESGVERHGAAERLRSPGPDLEQPVHPETVGGGGRRVRTEGETGGVRGPTCPAPGGAATGGEGGGRPRVEDGLGDGGGLCADLRDGGRLPQLATAGAPRVHSGRVVLPSAPCNRPSSVATPMLSGPGTAAPWSTRLRHSGSAVSDSRRPGPVQSTTQPTGSVRGPSPVVRETVREPSGRAEAAASRPW
ncbi:hypothetical protein SSPO_084210 [Streptomyces antimycoticus]|uniref:Uncharacterized protein n=1 Tax=Streptomyces antimycoticus TaxID=68175 RepID=A0A499UUJ5_9ACTN|nr:hypothetical protein SSPO_084210 [Streptomyces antimycoticus]